MISSGFVMMIPSRRRSARIYKVMPSPLRTATLPAPLGVNTPPKIPLIPMVGDNAVAVLAGPNEATEKKIQRGGYQGGQDILETP
jgi:hypothetical protein